VDNLKLRKSMKNIATAESKIAEILEEIKDKI